MKNTIKLGLIAFFLITKINDSLGQEFKCTLSNTYVNPFGENTDLVGLVPLFKLESDSVHNKQLSVKIGNLPKGIDLKKAAYGFIYFSGIRNAVFDGEITLLVEDYLGANPKIYVDENGNIDFSDDGEPQQLDDNFILSLRNSDDSSALYHYRIKKSQIDKSNEQQIHRKYNNRYPKNSLISPTNWLTTQRLSVRVSKAMIDDKPISILLYDQSADGQFTFQTNEYGDRILITEDSINLVEDLISYLRKGEPVDHNAVFFLYNKNYSLSTIEQNGQSLSLLETNKKTKLIFTEGQDISSIKIQFLSGRKGEIQEFIKPNKHLLIDVGGTWCGGCITQESTIKQLYNNQEVEIIGVFGNDTMESVLKYVTKHNIKWPVALMSLSFADLFRIDSYPTFILVSPEGKIILMARDSEEIVKYLNK